MTDIFFSYSSADRERVRPVRDALVAQGFEVFWDQQVPAGVDWDTWIRQHLASCKCALVFWSSTSITSRNVRHEATIADQEGKLIPVLLEPLSARQFPMGLYAQQAANLANWNGDSSHEEWDKLRREYETKMMPQWVRQRMDEKDAELVAERARRQGAERRDKTLQAQIAKEAETQVGLQRERDSALDEITALKGTVEELTRARSDAEARETDTLQQVSALKATVDEVTRARSDAEQRLSKLRQTKAKEIVRSISPFVIAAAVATIGFWTYHLVGSASPPTAREQGSVQEAALLPVAVTDEVRRKVEEAEQFRKEAERQANLASDADAKRQAAEAEVQRQAKVIVEAQTKLQAAQAEQQSQAKAATDTDTKRQAAEKAAAEADSKRKAAEADQQRLKDEVQRQTKAVADADTKRRDSEAAQQRLTEELRKLRAEAATKQVALPQATSTVMASSFESRPNMEAGYDKMPAGSDRVSRVEACQERCIQSGTCQAFTFNKSSSFCYLYDQLPSLRSNPNFDSGVRQPAALPANQPASTVAIGPFTRRPNEQASGYLTGAGERTPSIGECERRCTQSPDCRVFTYNKIDSFCALYIRADFIPNPDFDSGVRK